jgi:iron complex outermembrane receptor protein
MSKIFVIVSLFFIFNIHLLYAQQITIRGYIKDSKNDEFITQCSIVCIPSNVSLKSNTSGFFQITLPKNSTIDVVFTHPSYKETHKKITNTTSDTININVFLTPRSFSTKTVVVEDAHFHSGIREGESDILISGDFLRKNLSPTIAETMKNIQGISVQSMGSSTSRPILRGLGGDRVLLLEDGQKSGDLSATSADHAVSIDPQSINHIEVIRGPMALLYSSNCIGGLINITRNTIPTSLPSDIQGNANFFGESVSRLASFSGNIELPISNFSVRSDFSYKNNQPYHTPIGLLNNTQSTMVNSSVGTSYFADNGYTGLGFSYFDNVYGIPPDSILGHPKGVSVSMRKSRLEAKSEWYFPKSIFKRIEILGNYIDYSHIELEASGAVGMLFLLKTTSLTALSELNTNIENAKTTAGMWFEHRNFQSGGFTFTPNTNEYASAVMMHHSQKFQDLTFDASLRYDLRNIVPFQSDSSVAGIVEKKLFSNYSGAIELNYNKFKDIGFGTRLLRSFRSPLTEELFSEGPHLAAYSYEVGNASLKEEIGTSFELFSTFTTESIFSKISVYSTYFQNFIIPVNTGERSLRRNDLFLFKYIGQDALFMGYEFLIEYKVHNHFHITANSSYTDARFVESGDFVPRIPPLISNVECVYKKNSLEVTIGVTNGLAQRNLGDFETITNGYTLLHCKTQYQFQWNSSFNTLSFSILNATNQLYRNHLNRIKDVAPEQGINARLLYTVHF